MRTGTAFAAIAALIAISSSLPATADVISQYGGTYTNWPTTWIALNGLNDPDDGVAEQLDFVGNAAYPGGYFQWDANYVYFRMRIDEGTIGPSTFSDALFVLVDLPGYAHPVHGVPDGRPDYAFAWDSNQVPSQHGVELQIPSTVSTIWADQRNADIDGQSGQKIAPPDFALTGGEAYLRTVDGIPTVDFGTTSFVDWAISFDHIAAYTELDRGQTWSIQFASIANSNDHGTLSTDIGGGFNPDDPVEESPGDTVTTPEPGTLALLSLGIAGIGAWRRRKAA